jgi:dihydroorotate dehydrogenase
MDIFPLIKPLLYRLSPEYAHKLVIWALKHQSVPAISTQYYPKLHQQLWGLSFSNPVGLAAGFDKNAACIPALLKQGFGSIEVGTVTPRPQSGNPKPRLFRLDSEEAIINRLGFNNAGIRPFFRNMNKKRAGIVGANIGKNKLSTDPMADYLSLVNQLYLVADYITINISSPNTPGLRDLQQKKQLCELLKAIHTARISLSHNYQRHTPIFLKIAPDLSDENLDDVLDAASSNHIDALIISNTTIQRPDGKHNPLIHEAGGLSGKPLFELSTALLAKAYHRSNGTIPLIGVGGIASASDAYAKIRAGACLIQLYTSLIFNGFSLVESIKQGLNNYLERDGFTHLSEIIGIDAKDHHSNT